MKKILFVIGFGFFLITSIMGVLASTNIIPDEAIRLRVLANSNTVYDQAIKVKVRDKVQGTIYTLLQDTNNISEAKEILENNIDNIGNVVQNVLKENNYSLGYDINFGSNYFPEKEYKGVKYKEGYYESILITLGEGKGDNWWCVLFPPLCLIEAEESTDVEYQFFVKELIQKYF